MADLGNGGNHLEAELRELDGVAGAFALRDATGNPVEIQIFSRAGASAARIRKAVGDVLAKKGHELSPDAVSVFELAADSPAGRWVFAPPGPVSTPASSDADSSPTILPTRPLSIPVASLLTTALAIVGLLLLLTAPWVALTRLMSEPLETAASTTRAPDGLNRGGSDGGASTKLPPVTVTLEPTPPPNQVLVAGPTPASPRARTVRVRTGPAAIVAASTPLPPPVIATPTPAASGSPSPPTITTGRGSGLRLSALAEEDESDEDDDDAEERKSRRRGPKVVGFIPLPPGHERHHDRTRNGKASGLDKHKHQQSRDDEEDED